MMNDSSKIHFEILATKKLVNSYLLKNLEEISKKNPGEIRFFSRKIRASGMGDFFDQVLSAKSAPNPDLLGDLKA